MKMFGSTERFGIQTELLEPAGEFVVVHIRLWADGMQIGDYQQPVLLSPIADFFRATIRRSDLRADAELALFPPERVLEAVKASLFTDDEVKSPSQGLRNERLESFREICICPNGCAAFDGEMAVLLQRAGAESFIWQDFGDKRVRELRLMTGDYATVVRMFLGWADSLTGHDPSSDHFAGRSFVIVGKLSKSHSDIERIIRRLGGRVDYAVSGRTSYVLAGQSMSQEPRQVQKARALDVPLLSEAEFESLLPPQSSEHNPS
ncbi:BRCT domain-containing protein [Variovorax sp. J22R115]|uniref:BRCT domain-containing protein n=1 Tax=Variovorax sp. J22R115 TaxID=3053509 RepID=UPI0025770AEB|nr:BRCT domain-containing protein [Variovorax sp. J22R115]MDM0047925.1 BRCT domain-containing protein [Variovorax sp. J22R115]